MRRLNWCGQIRLYRRNVPDGDEQTYDPGNKRGVKNTNIARCLLGIIDGVIRRYWYYLIIFSLTCNQMVCDWVTLICAPWKIWSSGYIQQIFLSMHQFAGKMRWNVASNVNWKLMKNQDFLAVLFKDASCIASLFPIPLQLKKREKKLYPKCLNKITSTIH